MTIIDTLTAGFNTVTRRLWLIIVPALLDVILWLVPKVSVAPIVERAIATLNDALNMLGSSAASADQTSEALQVVAEQLRGTIGQTNLLSFMAWNSIGLPGIARLRPIDVAGDVVIAISSAGWMFWLFLAILAVGLLITCLYLSMIGQEVRGTHIDLAYTLRNAPRYWIYLVLLFVPLAAGLLTILSIGSLLGPLLFVAWGIALWALLYFSFTPEAVTMAEADPLSALRASIIIVRLNFWPTLGLVVLVNIITIGLSLLWARMLGSPLGTLAAIAGNAYVGTSLTTAMFIFYRERIALWHEFVQQQRSGGHVG